MHIRAILIALGLGVGCDYVEDIGTSVRTAADVGVTSATSADLAAATADAGLRRQPPLVGDAGLLGDACVASRPDAFFLGAGSAFGSDAGRIESAADWQTQEEGQHLRCVAQPDGSYALFLLVPSTQGRCTLVRVGDCGGYRCLGQRCGKMCFDDRGCAFGFRCTEFACRR